MTKNFLATFAAVLTTLFATHVHAQTLVDDWTLNEGSGFTDASGSVQAVDSVGANTTRSVYDPNSVTGSLTFGTSSIGGPSDHPVYFPGGLGWYNPADRTTFPTDNFTVSLYLETTNLSQTSVIFSSNSGNPGSFEIGLKNGDFVAILNDGTGNLKGTTIGSFAATAADTELSVTDINGHFTFTDNGVNSAPVAATDTTDAPLSGIMIGVPSGGADTYIGYMSDVTVTANVTSLVPEPSTYLMVGLGFLGLIALRRFRRANS
jgi:hypothetical protein